MLTLVSYLVNDAQAARIRLLISVLSLVARTLLFVRRYFANSFTGHTSTLMLSIDTSFLLFDSMVAENFVSLSGWIFNTTLSVLFLKSHIMLLSCSRDVENNITSSANGKF